MLINTDLMVSWLLYRKRQKHSPADSPHWILMMALKLSLWYPKVITLHWGKEVFVF